MKNGADILVEADAVHRLGLGSLGARAAIDVVVGTAAGDFLLRQWHQVRVHDVPGNRACAINRNLVGRVARGRESGRVICLSERDVTARRTEERNIFIIRVEDFAVVQRKILTAVALAAWDRCAQSGGEVEVLAV